MVLYDLEQSKEKDMKWACEKTHDRHVWCLRILSLRIILFEMWLPISISSF